MADAKGSALPALTAATAASNDKVYVLDVSAGDDGSKTMTLDEMTKKVNALLIANPTALQALADAIAAL